MTRYTMEDVETDNRDGNQTDLHLPNGTILELTLVDMIELLHNIVENTREEQDA